MTRNYEKRLKAGVCISVSDKKMIPPTSKSLSVLHIEKKPDTSTGWLFLISLDFIKSFRVIGFNASPPLFQAHLLLYIKIEISQ